MTDTSIAALKAFQRSGRAATVKTLLKDRLRAVASTSDELESYFNWPHQTVSSVISRMWKKREVYDTGRRRQTRNGRDAIVWGLPMNNW